MDKLIGELAGLCAGITDEAIMTLLEEQQEAYSKYMKHLNEIEEVILDRTKELRQQMLDTFVFDDVYTPSPEDIALSARLDEVQKMLMSISRLRGENHLPKGWVGVNDINNMPIVAGDRLAGEDKDTIYTAEWSPAHGTYILRLPNGTFNIFENFIEWAQTPNNTPRITLALQRGSM